MSLGCSFCWLRDFVRNSDRVFLFPPKLQALSAADLQVIMGWYCETRSLARRGSSLSLSGLASVEFARPSPSITSCRTSPWQWRATR